MLYEITYSRGVNFDSSYEKPVIFTDSYKEAIETANKLASIINADDAWYFEADEIDVRCFHINQYLVHEVKKDYVYSSFYRKLLWTSAITKNHQVKLVKANVNWTKEI